MVGSVPAVNVVDACPVLSVRATAGETLWPVSVVPSKPNSTAAPPTELLLASRTTTSSVVVLEMVPVLGLRVDTTGERKSLAAAEEGAGGAVRVPAA